MLTNDFNNFRARYDSMSFQEMQEFYEKLKQDHPKQQHYNEMSAEKFFLELNVGRFRVLELGGWDGELASKMIPKFNIDSWVNYEICTMRNVCDDPRYDAPGMTDFLWDMDVDFSRFNVFFASHVLEHLSDIHLKKMFDCIPHIKHVYVDMPSQIHHHNTTAAHVLENSWEKVNRILEERK